MRTSQEKSSSLNICPNPTTSTGAHLTEGKTHKTCIGILFTINYVFTFIGQFVVGEDGEVAAADADVVPSEARQRPQRHTQQLLLPAGAHP